MWRIQGLYCSRKDFNPWTPYLQDTLDTVVEITGVVWTRVTILMGKRLPVNFLNLSDTQAPIGQNFAFYSSLLLYLGSWVGHWCPRKCNNGTQ